MMKPKMPARTETGIATPKKTAKNKTEEKNAAKLLVEKSASPLEKELTSTYKKKRTKPTKPNLTQDSMPKH